MESSATGSATKNSSEDWGAVRWKTISRRDPDFAAYLDGSFSSEERALPVRSLNVATVSEEVTFEIVPVASIESPGFLKAAWLLVRPATLVLSFGPMLATLMHALARGQDVRGAIALFSFIGVLLFHAAVNLFNDYYDHVTGQDRLRLKGGSRVIQKGWLRALDVKRIAWALMGLATACALPAVYFHFSPVAVVAGLAGLAGLEFAFGRLGLKYRGFAEIMAFALTGPLLTAGYAWSITGSVSWGDATLGCVFGAISLMYFHLSNFENIMTDNQAGVRTWATRAGFDASKTFFFFTAALTLGTMIADLALFDHDWHLLPTLAAQIVFLVPLARRVHELASPLSSDLTGIRKEALKLSWLTLAVFAAGCLR